MPQEQILYQNNRMKVYFLAVVLFLQVCVEIFDILLVISVEVEMLILGDCTSTELKNSGTGVKKGDDQQQQERRHFTPL